MKKWKKKRRRKRNRSKVVAIQDQRMAVSYGEPEFLPGPAPMPPGPSLGVTVRFKPAPVYRPPVSYDYVSVDRYGTFIPAIPSDQREVVLLTCHLHDDNGNVLCGTSPQLMLPVHALPHDIDGHCPSCHYPRCPTCAEKAKDYLRSG